ncbi:hypothetical protein SGLAM104S_04070 [Streptomyces glaucescens]
MRSGRAGLRLGWPARPAGGTAVAPATGPCAGGTGCVGVGGIAVQRVVTSVLVEGGFVSAWDHIADEVREFPLRRFTGGWRSRLWSSGRLVGKWLTWPDRVSLSRTCPGRVGPLSASVAGVQCSDDSDAQLFVVEAAVTGRDG